VDACDGLGACLHILAAGCLIDMTCVETHAVAAGNDCVECNPVVLGTGYSPVPEGVACADEGKPNTLDVCDGSGTCTHPLMGQCTIDGVKVDEGTANPSNPCQSCDPATSVDAWTDRASGFPCADDSLDCTSDTCDDKGACGHVLFRGCLVDDACVPEGTNDPKSECQYCDPALSTTAFTPRAKGVACTDDGDPDTTDACDGAGACVHQPVVPVEPTPDGEEPEARPDEPSEPLPELPPELQPEALPDVQPDEGSVADIAVAEELGFDVAADVHWDEPVGQDLSASPSIRVTGGQCSAARGPVDGAGATAVLLVLCGLFLVARRRRVPFGQAGLSLAAVLGMTVGMDRETSAQQLDVQRFHPSPFTTDLFMVETGRPPTGCGWNVGLLMDYQRDPLEVRLVDALGNESRVHAIRDRLTGTLTGAYRFVDWFALGASFPIVMYQNGDGIPGSSTPGVTGIGDLRIYPRFRILSALDDRLTMSITPGFALPTGRLTGAYNGYKYPVFVPTIALGMDFGPAGLAATLGASLTSTETIGSTDPSLTMTWGVGGWVTAVPRTLDVLAELTGGATLGRGFTNLDQAPIEVDAGVRWRMAPSWLLTAGAGASLTSGYGAPVARAFAGVTWQCEQVPAAEPPPPPAPSPEPDRDGDDIPDKDDKCPDVKGDAAHQGCPPPPPVVTVEPKRIVIMDRIEFDLDSATFRPEALPVLDQVVRVLAEHPEIGKVRIEGHTDNQASAAYNLGLSERRAQAVMKYLADKGIDPKRLEAKGYGLTKPIADNATEEGRFKNRRVEFMIVEQ
jgi:outer membrane protein OmpA-like peptidoglycan-associated protein